MYKNFLKIVCFSALLTLTLNAKQGDVYKGVIQEVTQTPTYTYIKVKTNDKEFWAAVIKTLATKGDTIELSEQVWLENFPSKALKKTFDKILFADVKGSTGIEAKKGNIHGMHGQNIKRPNPSFNKGTFVSKEKAISVKDITEIYANKAQYKNKNITFTATVEQVSNKVMGDTWVKLKNDSDSIIFRSNNENEPLKIGDKVKVVGTLNTDVDYGYGFKYEAIGVAATFTKIQ